jgi:hypothetical protein
MGKPLTNSGIRAAVIMAQNSTNLELGTNIVNWAKTAKKGLCWMHFAHVRVFLLSSEFGKREISTKKL